jgi:methylglutaconyl-CoA hydratase
VDPEELDGAVAELMASVRLTEPNAVRATKDVLVRLPTMGLDEGFAWATDLSQRLFDSPEAAEGIRAFREKRPPAWAPTTD